MKKAIIGDDPIKWVLTALLIGAVICGLLYAAFLVPQCLQPTYTADGIITYVGYKGITVEFNSAYGEKKATTISVDEPTKYNIGEAVTISVKGSENNFVYPPKLIEM